MNKLPNSTLDKYRGYVMEYNYTGNVYTYKAIFESDSADAIAGFFCSMHDLRLKPPLFRYAKQKYIQAHFEFTFKVLEK